MPMTWKKSLGLIFFIMLAALLTVNFIMARQRIQVQPGKILGVRSLFPAGRCSAVRAAKNGWQGFAFAANFRFFSRSGPRARDDFKKLLKDNFSRSPLQQDLALFDGGAYILQKAGKGYRMFCLFYHGDTNYWADMFSQGSLHFSRQAFEQFILHLDIDGKGTSPAVAGQIRSLQKKVSLFFMQTPAQLLGMMAAICALTMFIAVAVNIFSGSCPRRQELLPEVCVTGATLVVKGFGRRRVIACCLCREGDFLVIYRFRRLFLKIAMSTERKNVIWDKNSLNYKNYRVILAEDDFQNWRSRFF